jgi:hypothetical protein
MLAYALTVSADSQNNDTSTGITMTCKIPVIVKSNGDLLAKIIFRNNSPSNLSVYKELVEGDFNNMSGNNLVNFRLIVQRRRDAKFEDYLNRSYVDRSFNADTADILSKAELKPGDSIVEIFHIDTRYQFSPGEYRIRCLYWNDVHDMNNVASHWVYFKVVHPVYIKHYY